MTRFQNLIQKIRELDNTSTSIKLLNFSLVLVLVFQQLHLTTKQMFNADKNRVKLYLIAEF